MHILIIEDNRAIAANLVDWFEARGHAVEAAYDGVNGFRLAAARGFDAICLDLGLPGMDGTDVCRRLREEAGSATPILMLTARDTLKEKLAGFDNGADDYLVKPFALEEVEARLLALHKRSSGKVANAPLTVGALRYDSTRMRVSCAGNEVTLQPKCLRLLELLMGAPNRVFSRRELELELWGELQDSSDRLRNHVSTLRRALQAAGAGDPVKTVHGIGFVLEHR